MVDDLKIVKKKYGEDMMHLCRESFPIILEEPGQLKDLMLKLFYPSHELIKDIKGHENDFKNLIYKYYRKKEVKLKETDLTPEELLRKKGYTLYECKTNEEILYFKKYYAKDEELCTFNVNRLNTDYVYFAVKDNADTLKREEFTNPQRQDEYGTSVISIQFSKNDSHYLSIKNRYNHTVNNPDSTFSNNLDNIVEGLTYSFEKYKGMKQAKIQGEFELKNYTPDETGKYYKYNYEINNINYCPDNIIIKDHKARKLPNWVILADYFLIDLKHKKILSYENNQIFYNFGDIKDIKVTREETDKLITIIHNNDEITKIKLNKNNQIIEFFSSYIEDTQDDFLYHNESIKKIILPKCKKIGDRFMRYNEVCENFEAPVCEEIGNYVLENNNLLKKVILPKCKKIGSYFMHNSEVCENFEALVCEEIGNYVLEYNDLLKKVILPKCKKIGAEFIYFNEVCEVFEVPLCEQIDDEVLYYSNPKIINIPDYASIGANCFGGSFENTRKL